MKPIKEYLFNPDHDIGGAIVPIIGKPGVGKTIALTQIALKSLKEDQVCVWRGTKQAQWINIVANDKPVTIWNDENIEGFKAFITSNKPGKQANKIDLEEKENVQVKTFEDTEDLIQRLDKKRVNVINVPGLQNDQNQDHNLYYFRKTWVDIIDELISREWLSMVNLVMDEGGDLFPCNQQLRKPFYGLIAYQMPPKLSQLRKQNTFMYIAGHSTHDMHYMIWKVKGNSVIYMSGSNVKKNITPSIDQDEVNRLKRGEFYMPPDDKSRFKLPNKPDSLNWIPNATGKQLRLDWDHDCPNLLEKAKDNAIPVSKHARIVYDNTDMSLQDVAEIFDVSDTLISNTDSVPSKRNKGTKQD